MSTEESRLPETWRSILAAKGIHSYGDFAAKTGVSRGTLNRLLRGIGDPSDATVQRVAEVVFGGDTAAVLRLRYPDAPLGDLWELPHGARYLTSSQRDAIRAVVAGMLPEAIARRGGEGNADGDAGGPPATKPGPVGPAPLTPEQQRRFRLAGIDALLSWLEDPNRPPADDYLDGLGTTPEDGQPRLLAVASGDDQDEDRAGEASKQATNAMTEQRREQERMRRKKKDAAGQSGEGVEVD